MSYLFQVIAYQPILNLLVFIYNSIPYKDLGVSIILITIVIKLLLAPLSKQALKSQKALQELQPKIDAIKKDYAEKKEEMGRAMLELYKENKVNPLSSCLPVLVQLPFLFAVFKVFREGFSEKALSLIYPFLHKPESINYIFLGFVDLSKSNIYLAVMAAIAQFYQAKMMISKRPVIQDKVSQDEDMTAIMNKQMTYFMPLMTLVLGMSMPGGLTLYWLVTTLLTIAQQHLVFSEKAKNI